MAPRKVDATGRSAGLLRAGKAKRWNFEGQFLGHPIALRESPVWPALNWPARKILDFIEREHLHHGGAENGRLLAPHAQLRARGISGRKIKPGLDLLEALGVIRCTSDGYRLGGRPKAATYALTWYPTVDGALPTEDFRKLSAADVAVIVAGLKAQDAGDD